MSPGLDINSFPAGFSFYLNNRFLEAVLLFTAFSRECSELGSVCGLYVHKLLDNFHILKEWGAALPDSSISLEAAEDLEDFLVLEPGSRSRSHRQETSSPKSSSSTASFQVKLHISYVLRKWCHWVIKSWSTGNNTRLLNDYNRYDVRTLQTLPFPPATLPPSSPLTSSSSEDQFVLRMVWPGSHTPSINC